MAIVLYAALPSALVVLGPRFLVPLLELALLVPLLVGNPRRMTRETKVLRWVSIGLILLIALANIVALVLLVDELVNGGHTQKGGSLLIGAAQVWLTNIIVFALAYWELDRGGPVVRTRVARSDLPPADFRFPQDEDHDAIDEVAVRSAQEVRLVARVPRLPLRLDDELLGVQPDRHDAAVAPGQDADGHRVGLGAAALGASSSPAGSAC